MTCKTEAEWCVYVKSNTETTLQRDETPFDIALTSMTILFRRTMPYRNFRTAAPYTAFAAYSIVWRNTQSHFQLAMTVASYAYAACHIYTLYR
jgi:hypothetical protein